MNTINFADRNKLIFLGRTTKAKQNHLDVDSRWPDLWMVPYEGVIHENDSIRIPKYVSNVKPEVELAVVIGDSCHALPPNEIEPFIEGYTICNDVTARSEWPGYSDPSFGRSGFGYKMFPTFSPVLSQYTEYDKINNIHNLNMRIKIDGEQEFETSTRELDFSIPELVSYASKICKLKSGDLISLGGAGIHDLYLDTVDTVTCEIEKIGQLENKVISKA